MTLKTTFNVLQPGARLNYAVPRILHKAELLQHLYTDIHGNHWYTGIAKRFLQKTHFTVGLKGLQRRSIPEIPCRKYVKDFPFRMFALAFTQIVKEGKWSGVGGSKFILEAIKSKEWNEHSIFYSFLINEDLETLLDLKQKYNVKWVHDCMSSPMINKILKEESAKYPSVAVPDDPERIERGGERDKLKYQNSDLVMVPSQWIERQVWELSEGLANIAVVPYGLDFSEINIKPNQTVKGRIFGAGRVSLLKGTHYFARASRILKTLDFVWAGSFQSILPLDNLFIGPRYLGQISGSEVRKQLYEADVFAFPTLSEGMAMVHLEALAHGVPVVTTPACGSVVRDGVDGFIVDEKDPELFAAKIEEIVGNRWLRNWMSDNAVKRAQEYSLDRYAERLLAAVQPLTEQ